MIVFTQWRDSVAEIVRLLSSCDASVRAAPFIGQSATTTAPVGDDEATTATTNKGLTQREQQTIVARFREGSLNVLVATCIGEEGLDVGEVGFIVSNQKQ